MNGLQKKSTVILCIFFGLILIFALFGIFKEYKGAKSYSFNTDQFPSPTDSTVFSLPKGNYILDFSYQAQNDLSISLKADNDQVIDISLPASEDHVSLPFTLEHPSDRAKFTILTDDPASIQINAINLYSEGFLYTDFIFHLILLALTAVFLIFILFKYPHTDMKNVIFLTIVCVLINLPLFIFKGSNWGVDTRVHMLRTEGIMTGLLDGQLPVIIAPNYLNEYGELSFLYPDFFLYPFGILRILGVSMFTVYRFMMIVINIATVFSIYYSARIICKKNLPVYTAVILYTFEAHRLRIMFMNGAGGGAGIAQIFIPLCIAGFYLMIIDSSGLPGSVLKPGSSEQMQCSCTNKGLSEGFKGSFLLAFGITGVMESHIMSLLLLGAFLAVLFLSFIRTFFAERCRKLRFLLLSIILTLIMNGGFLVIFVSYYFSDWSSAALFWSDFISWCLTPKDILTSPQSHFYLVMLLISVILLVIIRKNLPESDQKQGNQNYQKYRLALTMTIFTGVMYFMATSFFPWKILMNNSKIIFTLAMFIQQAHRFFSLIEAPAVLSPLLLLSIEQTEYSGSDCTSDDQSFIHLCNRHKSLYFILPVMMIMLFTGIFSEMKMFFSNSPLLFDRITGDYNTELLLDYVPTGADEDSIGPDAGKLSDDSEVESLSYSKRGTHIDYSYISRAEGVYADLPLFYYIGYQGTDENGLDIALRKGSDGHILADLKGDGLQHSIHVRFKVKPLFTVLWLLSLAVSLAIVCIFIYLTSVSSRTQ